MGSIIVNSRINTKRSKKFLARCHRMIEQTYANVYDENKVSRNLKKYVSFALDQMMLAIIRI